MFAEHTQDYLSGCILAIDVGSEKSGFTLFCKTEPTPNKVIVDVGKVSNSELKTCNQYFNTVIIEYPDSVQPNVGHEFISMVWWLGRLHEHFNRKSVVHLLGRKEIKSKLKAKTDIEVRKALLKFYGKDFCHKLFPVSKNNDAWQAFALIHCYLNHG